MSEKYEIENAVIEATRLGTEDHGCLSYMLHLKFDGTGQGFGGYVLDTWDESKKHRIGVAYGAETIRRILEVLEVEQWENLPGTPVRVDRCWTNVRRIGHYLKDKWFDPKELAKEMMPELNMEATPCPAKS